MKCSKSVLKLALVPLVITSASAQLYTDNFNDNAINPALWGAVVAENNGQMVEANQRMEYRVSSPNAEFDSAYLPTATGLPADQDWRAEATVRNAANAANGNVSVGIGILRPAAPWEAVYVELFLEGSSYQGFLTALEDEETVYGENFTNDLNTNDASVRMIYRAATKVISTYMDVDGPAGPAGFQLLASFGLAGSGGTTGNRNWNLTGDSEFTFGLSAFSEGVAASAGQVYLDDARVFIGAPSLSIAWDGANIRLSWPAPASDYRLETNATASTQGWTTVTTQRQLSGDMVTVTIPRGSGNAFYRLVWHP